MRHFLLQQLCWQFVPMQLFNNVRVDEEIVAVRVLQYQNLPFTDMYLLIAIVLCNFFS